jgi:hypothetical protein
MRKEMKKGLLCAVFAVMAASLCYAKEEVIFRNDNNETGVHESIVSFGRMTQTAASRVIDAKLEDYGIEWDFGDDELAAEAANFIFSEFSPVPNSLFLFERFEAGTLEWYFIYFTNENNYVFDTYLGLLGG